MAKEISNLITFNTYKFERGGLLVDMFNQFNARVGDQGTELAIQWETSKTETKINLKERELHFFAAGSVGQYLEKLEDGTGFKMSADASTVEWEDKDGAGSLDDGITVAKLPKQFLPKIGICFGYFGLQDKLGNVFTFVNVWFRVLGGVPTMGAAIPYFVTEFDEVLERCNGKIVDALAELREKYQAEVKKNEDMSAETRAALSKLADAVGAVQAQIDSKNIVTHQQFDNLSKNITQMAAESFAQPKAFASLTELQTAYPTGAKGTFITSDNNHYYMWQDNNWHDFGGYFNADIANNSIHLPKLSSSLQDAFTPDVTEVAIKLKNGFLSVKDNQVHSNKEVTQDSEGRYSDDIQVSPGEEYFVHGQSFWSGSLVVFKNSNGVVDFYPKNTLDHTVHTLQVTVPADADTMVINTDSYTIPRVFKINAYNTFEQVVQNLGFMLDKKKFNFQDFSIQKMSQYGFWSHKNGSFNPLTPNDTNADIAYQPIKVSPLEVYRITGCSAWDARLCTIIDAKGKVIASYPETEDRLQQTEVTVVMPANAAFLEINEVLPGATTKVEKATSIIDTSELPGVKWCAIGDSWTTIHADKGQGYVKNVAEQLGIVADNAGGSGTGYMTSYKTEPFYQRKVSSDADAYTIFGSFNDAYNPKFKFGQSGDTGTDTFWGAIKATVDNVYGTNFDAQIGIIAPGPWGAINPHIDKNAKMSSLATFEDSTIGDMSIVEFAEKYVQTLHDYAKENSLPFLDLYHYSNLRPWDSSFINKYYHGTSDTDNTHPNAIAFAKFIAPKISNFIEKII